MNLNRALKRVDIGLYSKVRTACDNATPVKIGDLIEAVDTWGRGRWLPGVVTEVGNVSENKDGDIYTPIRYKCRGNGGNWRREQWANWFHANPQRNGLRLP